MALSNGQYGEIMREYDRRQLTASREKQERIRAIYEALPAVKRLDGEIAAESLEAARSALFKKEKQQEMSKERLAFLREQKKRLLVEAGYPADYMETHYICPECKDTGYIGQEKCRCFKKLEAQQYLEQSGLKGILEKENFSTYSEEYYDNSLPAGPNGETVLAYMRGIVKRCRAYAENFETEKGNLLLTGPSGTGKTFLTHCIARELLSRGTDVYYLTAPELADVVAGRRFGEKERDEFAARYERVMECDLLILDDLGTEWMNALIGAELFNCLNERQLKGKVCVISTNLSIGKLSERYSERILSRIIGHYSLLELIGADIRIQKSIKSGRE